MSALHATSTQPGSLYIDGKPAATLGARPVRLELPPEGCHLLFAPHRDGYAAVAREIRPGAGIAPEGLEGLRAVLWPGGSIEAEFAPRSLSAPRVAAKHPFMNGEAQLLAGERVVLDVDGARFDVGTGPGCGLRPLPDGWLAAFAQEERGESLLIIAPGIEMPDAVLKVDGEQVLLSGEGDRVRVHERIPQGALVSAVREYRREGGAFAAQPPSIIPSAHTANTGMELAQAMAGAMQLGAVDEALAMLTPSLRAAVDAPTLKEFFGSFDSYTDARHAKAPPGLELLALLCPNGGIHVAKLMAFEVRMTDQGQRIDNIKAWE